MDWLRIHRGDAPLVVAFPHGGTGLAGLDEQFVSPWHAQIDTDWWIAELYAFAADLGATTVATDISRSVIDMNRDPSGASLYPGQATRRRSRGGCTSITAPITRRWRPNSTG
jgi:formiminoglutamase